MKSGTQGIFVIPWQQTEVDGQRGGPLEVLGIGSVWTWSGAPVRIDGPGDVVALGAARGAGQLRRRAARKLRKLLQIELPEGLEESEEDDFASFEVGFEVTDGRQLWHVTLIDMARAGGPLCLFSGGIPPRNTDLWVVRHNLDDIPVPRALPQSMLCFACGTFIETDEGPVAIEDIREGMQVQTLDDGFKPVTWTGSQRVSSARLRVTPDLAPLIVDGRITVSPDHRILVRGREAEVLFNASEVLVSARDLLGTRRVRRDGSGKTVTYHHVMLEAHQIIRASGIEAETYHPADLEPDGTAADYGPHARRCLTPPEAQILRHDAA